MPSSMHVLFFIIQFNGSLIPWTSAHLNRLLKTLSSSLYLKARNAELCNGDTPREHREVMPHYSLYREEKSLRHVAMVETFLDDNKPKLHLLNENSHCFKLHRSYSLSFNLSNVGEIFWIESERKRKRNFLCCVHLLRKAGSVKSEVSCRSRVMMAIKCAKKRHARAQLLFTNINLLPFLPFSSPSPSLLTKLPFVVIQKFLYHGNVTSYISSLLTTLNKSLRATPPSTETNFRLKLIHIAQRLDYLIILSWFTYCYSCYSGTSI